MTISQQDLADLQQYNDMAKTWGLGGSLNQFPTFGNFGIQSQNTPQLTSQQLQDRQNYINLGNSLRSRGYYGQESGMFGGPLGKVENFVTDKAAPLLPYAGMAALTAGTGALSSLGGAAGTSDATLGSAGTGVNTSGSIAGTAIGEGPGSAGMFGGANMPAYTAAQNATGAAIGGNAAGVGVGGGAAGASGFFGGGFAPSTAGATAASGAAGASGGVGGGLFGSGISSGTALGLAGLANNIYQNQQDRRLANTTSNLTNTLAQPQRQPYQGLLNSYFTGGQDITQQPIFANTLDLMNRKTQAMMASQQATGNQGAMAQEFNKNANQVLQSSALPYLSQLSGQAGFGFPASPATGSLYGQYSNYGNQQVGYGLSNLFAGMNTAPGENNTNFNPSNYINPMSNNTNSSGSGNGTPFGATVYGRA